MAPSVRLRRAGLIAVAISSLFLLSACTPPSGAAEDFPGRPVPEEAPVVDVGAGTGPDEAGVPGSEGEGAEEAVDPMEPNDEPLVVWWADGGQLALTISGSSSCPVVGTDIRVLEPAGEGNRVAISLKEYPADQVCTADFVPHTTLFWTPYDVTTTEPLFVEVMGTEVEVPIK
ncbi:hypothetical protein LQ757_04760 [Agromyces sp. SYSU K20354]|uniref:hypothetical protein n=1 Tax=Agromyces cavernae TaxID=2898659 RepID=UPI001E5D5B91|nr:hypothetical protein [Agromyces cavernae]MCD2441583.1 hypothetical protein [Agromyces cavernae]